MPQSPNTPDDLNALAATMEREGRFVEAGNAYLQSLGLDPHNPRTLLGLGNALMRVKNLDDAMVAYQRAIAIQPGFVDAWINLGIVLRGKKRTNEAIAALRRALALDPQHFDALLHLGIALGEAQELEETAALLRQASTLQPRSSRAALHLGYVLQDLGLPDEAIECYRRAWELDPASPAADNLLWLVHFHAGYGPKQIFEEHERWYLQCVRPLVRPPRPHENERSPDRGSTPSTGSVHAGSPQARLRIGYVAADFREHCQSYFTIPLLSHHDHSAFEIFCYSNVAQPDDVTQRIRGYADHWRDIVSMTDDDAIDAIRQDKIDILIDLTMHMDRNRIMIFARKPAPIQVTWLAYPGTTGLETIDYRLSDPYLDPPADDLRFAIADLQLNSKSQIANRKLQIRDVNQSFYSEKTIRLTHSFWCYDPLTSEPQVNELPALNNAHITFGCLNNVSKVTDSAIAMWAKVLRAVPNSRMQLLVPLVSVRKRVIELLARDGIDPSRIQLLDWQPRPQYLLQYRQIDLCLDPYPYPGHTTTMDGLWMGVPVVNLPGSTAIARGAVSILTNVGIPQFLARDADDYVQIAQHWANDLPALAELRRTLRQRMQASPLMNAPAFARDFETALRGMWRIWCSG
jgi:predicted O-linked N-acetylglucosamine transferase (SPINDLY family)